MAAHKCDNGWKHLCGGPHDLDAPDDTRTVVDVAPTGCVTERCAKHCSCFTPDGVHTTDCSQGV